MTNEQRMQVVANSLSQQLNNYVNMLVEKELEIANLKEQLANLTKESQASDSTSPAV